MPESNEDELVLLLVPGAVQEYGVDVRIQPQVGGDALQDADGPGLRAELALLTRTADAPRAEESMQKLFVVDTNVILFDHSCIYSFEEHDVAIPIVVLESPRGAGSPRRSRAASRTTGS